MMKKGEAWGEPVVDHGASQSAVTVDVRGDDADLASAACAHPGAVLRFVPCRDSNLARAVGLTGAPTGSTVLVCDAIQVRGGGVAVNAIVFGVSPDRVRWWHRRRPVVVEVDGRAVVDRRAFAVVVANGQFLRGADLVPRGHPGDGRIEVQVYAIPPGERASMRQRLGRGLHVPHNQIAERSGRRVTVRWARDSHRRGRPWEIDGHAEGRAGGADLEVVEGALRLIV
jgi:YegS C-terminal NAD kinase beta sandwich-like domain